MKRFFTSLILTFLILVALIAEPVESSTVFTVKAYKAGFADPSKPQVKLVVTDALYETLDTNASEIVLDNHVTSLLRDNLEINEFESQVIFSYRVEGNCPGTFKISVEVRPFQYGSASSVTALTSENAIDASYALRNITYVFGGGGGTESEDNKMKFTYTESTGGSSGILSYAAGGSSSYTFEKQWALSSTDPSDEVTSDVWIARGAVAMAIRSSENYSYGNAIPGQYVAPVTITLTSL